MRLLLDAEKCAEAWELPPVRHWLADVALVAGVADFVCFHQDETVSVVVVADDDGRPKLGAALDQLIAVGAAFSRSWSVACA